MTDAKNGLLPNLPNNSDNVKRMMKGLKAKLVKNGLLEQFNTFLKEFINSGMITPVSLIPKMANIQESFIPLCYSLANNSEATTKLRICINSSFKCNT